MRIPPTAELRERTSFIGRRREQELLLAELERGAALLTISGPSGLGKTRLARQAAQQAARFFEREGGAWFCDLTQSRTTADVEMEVARVLGVPQLYGEELMRAIGKRGRMLLVLDNFDSVASTLGERLGPWIDHCLNLQIIGTSIVPAGLLGESHLPLGPLTDEDAVELYLERAKRASIEYTIPKGEEALVEDLVRRLDRIPLAIELASARIRVLSPRALLSRLDERLELLRGGVPGRHASLEEALSLTWSLLNAQEKLLLSRVSLQPNGFGLEVARACLHEATESEVLELLDGLRSKALLQGQEGEHPRFFLFESVQLFARQILDSQGDEDEAYRAQRSALNQQAAGWAAAIESPKVLSALAWFRAESPNLVAILHRDSQAEPAQALRAGLPLLPPFEREGFPPGFFPTLELVLRTAREADDPLAIARVLLTMGKARRHHGQESAASELLREGLELARGADAPALTGEFHLELSRRLVVPASTVAQEAHLGEALRISREHGLPALESAVLVQQGVSLIRRGSVHEAAERFWGAVELVRAHELRWHRSAALRHYGVGLGMLGRVAESRSFLEEALERSRALGSGVEESYILVNLAGVEIAAGDLEEAERYAREGLERSRRLSSYHGEASSLASLGVIALYRDDPKLALQHLRSNKAIREEHDDALNVAMGSLYLSIAEAKSISLEKGRQTLRRGSEFLLANEILQDYSSFEIVGALLDVLEAQALRATAAGRAEELVRQANQTLIAAREGPASKENAFAVIRLLELELERWGGSPEEERQPAQLPPIRVGPDGEWFELPGRERVELRRRVALRRLFAALVRGRRERPGEGLAPHQLFEAGWPEVEIQAEAALRRVYIAIWTLRDLGLAELILNQTDGYLLDEHVPIVVESV